MRMNIATYNVNNIKKRFAPLAVWLKKARPDVVCLQELECVRNSRNSFDPCARAIYPPL
jgi:exonuclease III